MTRPGRLATFLFLAAAVTSGGCVTNAATFYEGTRFALVTEYNPASGQPVSLSLGYKRRIAAIVPPQEGEEAPAGPGQGAGHKGEALSLVSTFDVEAGGAGIGDGLVIKNTFAAGMAARRLTESNAEQNVRALFAGTSVPILAPQALARRNALVTALAGKIDNAKADAILKAAGLRPTPPARCTDKSQEALCTLETTLSRVDEATLGRLESAATQVIFAPAPAP
jgi:hypothetical protein